MVGFSTAKGDVDQRAGYLVVNLRNVLNDIANMKIWLDGQTDAQLTAIGYGGSASTGEIKLLRDTFTDLDNLRQVARGLRTQPAASDFFFNAKNVTGVQ